MTMAEVFEQILSEASGKPISEVKNLIEKLAKDFGGRTKLNDEISDTDAHKLLTNLRAEMPGIRAWLIKGSYLMSEEIKVGTKH